MRHLSTSPAARQTGADLSRRICNRVSVAVALIVRAAGYAGRAAIAGPGGGGAETGAARRDFKRGGTEPWAGAHVEGMGCATTV